MITSTLICFHNLQLYCIQLYIELNIAVHILLYFFLLFNLLYYIQLAVADAKDATMYVLFVQASS